MSQRIFAYGSNMCSARLRAYSISPEAPGEAALLPGWRLVFNKLSTTDSSGKANVEPDPNGAVWGVIYSIPDDQLGVLTKGEGGYKLKSMRVYTTSGAGVDAWVYLAVKLSNDPNLRPYTWYKQFLIVGAKEHDLPPAYIARLESVPADEDPNQVRDQAKRELMLGAG